MQHPETCTKCDLQDNEPKPETNTPRETAPKRHSSRRSRRHSHNSRPREPAVQYTLLTNNTPTTHTRNRLATVKLVVTCVLLTFVSIATGALLADVFIPNSVGLLNRFFPDTQIQQIAEHLVPHKNMCQLNGEEGTQGDSKLADWNAVQCQKVFQCKTHTSFLIQRTCTIEDKIANNVAPTPRDVPLLVSDKFQIAYILNPTAVDQVMQYILTQFLDSKHIGSHTLSINQIKSYFFFSFVDEPRDRFSLAFTQQHITAKTLNHTSTCQAIRTAAAAAITSGAIPSQAYFLSGDAGETNHALTAKWIADGSNVSNVLALLKHIQTLASKRNLCIPEINFLQVNFEFLRKNQQIYETVGAFRACLDDAAFWATVDEYYKQDTTCWFN